MAEKHPEGKDSTANANASDDAFAEIEAAMHVKPVVQQRANPALIAASWAVLLVMAAGGVIKLLRKPPEPPPRVLTAAECLADQVEALEQESDEAAETDAETVGEQQSTDQEGAADADDRERLRVPVVRGRIEVLDAVARDEDLKILRGIKGVRTLVIDKGECTDAAMDVIATLPNLEHLRLRHSEITDVGVKRLEGHPALRVLNLPHSKLTSAGVAVLATLPNLRQLRLGGDGEVDISRQVAKLEQLRAVHLIDVPVTDMGLKALAGMPRLESLYLDHPKVTEAGWEWLFEHHPNLHVHINQSHHDHDPNGHSHRGGEEATTSEALLE